MITDRDKEIIDFIELIGFSSINNIANMFFTNQKYSYDLSRRRLKKISEMGKYLKSFRNSETNEIIYIPCDSKIKRISIHNVKILEYICKLKTLGCEIKETEIEPIFGNTIPDAFVKFEFERIEYNQLLEVELRHDYVDLKRYKKPEVINSILERTEGYAPDLVIVQDTNKDYNKENDTDFRLYQLKTSLDGLAKVLRD